MQRSKVVQPVDEDARAALDSIRRVVRALRESSREAERKVGLSGAQLFVLQTLTAAGSEETARASLSQSELAARTMTHQSSVSVVVRRLVERGLIAERQSQDDGRRLELSVTARGRAVVARAPGAAQETLIAGMARLGPRWRRLLAESLGRLVAAMEIADGEPAMFFEEEEEPRGAKAKAKAPATMRRPAVRRRRSTRG